MRRTLAVLTFTALAFTATACGGDDEEPTNESGGESSEITKEDFIVQANAICVAGDAKAEEFTDPTTEDEAVDLIVNDVLPNISDQISDIRDLGFPEGDEDELGGILDDADAIIADINADPVAFLSEENPFGEVNAGLEAYGVTECADAS